MQLKRKFDAGEFAVLAEMEPPKGVDVSTMVSHAKRVKGAVDAFVVPEMSNAVMRMSSLGGAVILQNKGMETVMQLNLQRPKPDRSPGGSSGSFWMWYHQCHGGHRRGPQLWRPLSGKVRV